MTNKEKEVNEDYILSSLDNALSLLDCFDEEDFELSVPELAQKLNITKSSVYRIVHTLWARDYLRKNEENHKYSLGFKIISLGAIIRRRFNLIHEVRPYLKQLMEETGESIHLAILYENMATFIDKIESPRTMQMGSVVGARMPAYCTATGKMLLAGLSEEELEKYLQEENFQRLTHTTITDPRKLKEEIVKIRQQGYSIDNEESEEGLMCIGAPLKNNSNKTIATISVSGPKSRMVRKKQKYITEIKETAKRISAVVTSNSI